jgi:molybdenum cofactor cytidylyltransferase
MTASDTKATGIAAAVLAAGASTRLGSPKQLLRCGDQSLLELAISAATGADCHPVVTVLGAHADEITQELGLDKHGIIVNRNWEYGISSSIVNAIQFAESQDEPPNAIVFLVSDQPFVSSALIEELVSLFQTTGAPIVCCRYAGDLGVPALFAREMWPQLKALKGDRGARSVILENANRCVTVEFELGQYDVDTTSDLLTISDLALAPADE